MSSRHERIETHRLFEAAEAVLLAVSRMSQEPHRDSPFKGMRAEATPRPPVLAEFSRTEIEAATMFLIRLGVLDPTANR